MDNNLIITKPTMEEYKKSIKMLNKIFNLSFPRLLPKLYSKKQNYSKEHFIVKEDKNIVGAIASVKNIMHVDDNEIIARGVGMVGTKYSCRGKGIMTMMLERIYKEAIEDQTDILFLSGNFNRYNRYGFYPSGLNNIYTLRKVKEYVVNAKEYKFKSIKGNEEELKIVENIYNQQDIKWERKDFYECLKNWDRKAYFIYKNNELKGYLVAKGKTHMYEIITKNANVLEIITAWLTQNGRDSTKLEMNPYLSETNQIILDKCENLSVSTTESWSILNWQKVLSVMFNAKQKRQALRKGKVVVELDNEKYLIEVLDGETKISTTTKESDVVLTKGMATRIFFGANETFKTGNELLDSWLPVPIYISSCDTM